MLFRSVSQSRYNTFTIPWTFKFPFYKTAWIQTQTPDTQDGRPPHGYPIFWFDRVPSFYVSSVTLPARLRVFARVSGLTFYGPSNMTQMQSGAPAMAAAVAATIGTSIVTEAITSAFRNTPVRSIETGEITSNTYQKPQAVQLAYLGDTTSTGVSNSRSDFYTATEFRWSGNPHSD